MEFKVFLSSRNNDNIVIDGNVGFNATNQFDTLRK